MQRDQYVNAPAGDRSDGEQQRGNSPPGRSKILLLVGLSFSLLCIIQTAINVSVQLQAVDCSNSSSHSSTSNITRISDSDIRDLILERDQLLRDKDQLKREKDQLLHERDQLLQERDQLLHHKDHLVQDNNQLNQDKDQLNQDKDQLNQEKDQLLHEKVQLVRENNQLKREKDQLLQKEDQPNQDKDQLKQEKDQLLHERDQLLQERDQLLHHKDHLVQDNNQLNQDKDQLNQDKDQLNQEKDQLLHEKVQLVRENNQLKRENNQLKREKNQLIKDSRMLNETICKQQIQTERTTPSCPPGWRSYMSACYLLSSETDTWDNAKNDCAAKRAHLVVFNNEAEERAVVTMFGRRLKMWMGLRSGLDVTTLKWILEDGSQLHYAGLNNQLYRYNWITHESCGFTEKTSSSRNSWFMSSCQSRYLWICEMKRRNIRR